MLGLYCHKARILAAFCLVSVGIGDALLADQKSEIAQVAPKKTKGKKKAANTAAEVKNADDETPSKHSLARTYFRRKEYRSALYALDTNAKDLEALWIKAESHFRLDEFAQSKPFFEQILENSDDAVEKRKALVRLFDVQIATNNIQGAIDRYVAYGKEFKKPPAQMRYALGQALFESGHEERAGKILGPIPKESEFYLRSRYIMAAIGLLKRKPEAAVKLFRQIENIKPVTVEDYAVHQMAILAQGRLLIDAKREDLADKAYARVLMSSEFGETATIEIVRAWLVRAEQARGGLGRFKKASVYRRKFMEDQSVEAALKAIARFRKVQEIDWRKPELLTLMASAFVAARRYDEARLAYAELTDHFRPIYDNLRENGGKETAVWPYFSLDFNQEFDKPREQMIFGIPNVLVQDVPEISQILELRSRIIKDEQQLRKLEEKAKSFPDRANSLKEARSMQNAIANAYDRMVINKQKKISEKVSGVLNEALAEAENERARMVTAEIEDVKKQQAAVQDFQKKKIELFEKNLKKLEEGGSS